MVSRVISPRQLTQTLTGTSKRLGSLISSSPAVVLPRQTAQVQRGPSGAAASWSIEDPDARFRERRGHTVAVLRDSYPNFFSDLPNFEIYTHDSLPLPVEPLLPTRQTAPAHAPVPHLSRSPILALWRSGGPFARYPSIPAALRCASPHAQHRRCRRRSLIPSLAALRGDDPRAVARAAVATHAAPQPRQHRRRARRRTAPGRRRQPVRARRRCAHRSMLPVPLLASLASGCATPRPRWHASQPLRAAHWEAALRPGGPADAVGSPAALVW